MDNVLFTGTTRVGLVILPWFLPFVVRGYSLSPHGHRSNSITDLTAPLRCSSLSSKLQRNNNPTVLDASCLGETSHCIALPSQFHGVDSYN